MNKNQLIDELMTTKKLDAFFDDVERTMVTGMAAPAAEQSVRRGAWWIGGSIVGLALLGTSAWFATHTSTPVVQPVTSSASTRQAADPAAPVVGTTALSTPTSTLHPMSTAPAATRTTPATARAAEPVLATPSEKHLMLGQADATPSIDASATREIDSLSNALADATSTLDQARLTYQIGVRQRLYGNVDAAIASQSAARELARSSHATLLEARSLAEQARCEARKGRTSNARSLMDEALRILPSDQSKVETQWRLERESW